MTEEATQAAHAHSGTFAGLHSHGGGELHWHDEFGEHTAEEFGVDDSLRDYDWKTTNVELTTVGVDIGSSTSHLMFSKVHMQRVGEGAATRFAVVGREVLWKSPIFFTPYLDADTIDAAKLERFIVEAYHVVDAGSESIDTGAIILTGEALKRKNSLAITSLFAEEIGKFVCASAGHHLEAVLAANGSGTVSRSSRDGQTLLNIDIGGGTTKLALVDHGEIVATSAIAIGARLLAWDSLRRLTRVEEPARRVGTHLGIRLTRGLQFPEEDERRIAEEWTGILADMVHGKPPTGLAAELLLTEPLPTDLTPKAITFSGGVSEFIYLRETRDFRDMGTTLAKTLRRALMTGAISVPVVDPGQGIRATAIGASQFTSQVSGNTYVSDETILPLGNLPVLFAAMDLSGEIDSATAAAAIQEAARRADIEEGEQPVAVAVRWKGAPTAERVRALARGIADGIPRTIAGRVPFAVLVDNEIGRLVGSSLKDDIAVPGELVTLDGVAVSEFDYVDIAPMIHPSEVVPVAVKSLLFAGGMDRRSVARALAQAKAESAKAARAAQQAGSAGQ
jgi:ethanolamine utilization protein EutA